uniref:NR LBD domain-containing protein n=1 Tax=Panagrolaimus davidi TaxID=227884 RepID=A0A914PUM6_9BILA
MLAKFSPFSALLMDEKISLFLHFWHIFRLFERMFQAILYFKSTDEKDFRLQCSFDEFFDISNIKTIYHTSIPNPTFYSLMLPMFQKGLVIVSAFKRLNPKFEELVYICHITLWSCHEILKISPETQNLAEKITNQISADLHEYYTNELRVASYSTRQAQLFKLISLGEVVVRCKKQMIAGRKLFNFGQYYFPYCDFETNLFDYIDKNQL